MYDDDDEFLGTSRMPPDATPMEILISGLAMVGLIACGGGIAFVIYFLANL